MDGFGCFARRRMTSPSPSADARGRERYCKQIKPGVENGTVPWRIRNGHHKKNKKGIRFEHTIPTTPFSKES